MKTRSFINKAILPQGVKDILAEDAAKRDCIENSIIKIFKRWGYKRIRTSLLEYEDILAKGIDKEIKKGLLKFIDHSSGRVIAIRPDITPQVARIVATRLKEMPKPIRLYYSEGVLRSLNQSKHFKIKEIHQIGAELIGLDLPESDAEIIIMAIESLVDTGLKEFKIDIGHVGFLRSVLESLGISEEERRTLMKTITLKDRTGTLQMLSEMELKDDSKNLLFELLNLYGGKEVIEKGLSITRDEKAREALENLSSIMRFLDHYGVSDMVTIDLGEARGFHYYTGMIFEGFAKGIGRGIVTGGRYDNLLSQFGYKCPAVGFAFDLDSITEAEEMEGLFETMPKIDFLIFNRKTDKKDGIRIARSLRKKGYSVARDIIKRDYDASVKYCKKNRIANIICLGTEDVKDDEVMITSIDTGKKIKVDIEELIDGRMDLKPFTGKGYCQEA